MQELIDPAEPVEVPRTHNIIRIITGLIVIAGLIYISGIHQYLLYRRTPTTIEQERLGVVFDIEEISLPLTVFIFMNGRSYGSQRTTSDVLRLFENASRIWQQANIVNEFCFCLTFLADNTN